MDSPKAKAREGFKIPRASDFNQSTSNEGIGKFIVKYLEEFLNPDLSKGKWTARKGRPRQKKDTSKSKLDNLLLKHKQELEKKLAKDQRSDSETVKHYRHVKAFNNVLLRHCASKCKYKAKSTKIFLEEYLQTFCLGFCGLFQITRDINELIEHFFDFIILIFPIQKIESILNELQDDNCICEQTAKGYRDQVEIRRGAQKHHMELFEKNNKCFELLLQQFTLNVSPIIDLKSDNNQASVE